MEIHVDDLMHNLHPCHCSPVYEPIGRWKGGWGKMPTGVHRIGHPIHLNIKSSSTEVTLWWAFIWDTNIFMYFCPFREFYPYISSPISLSSIFQSCSFQKGCTTRCTAPGSAHSEDFPSLPSFKDIPERGYGAAVVYFQGVPAYSAEGLTLLFSCELTVELPRRKQV